MVDKDGTPAVVEEEVGELVPTALLDVVASLVGVGKVFSVVVGASIVIENWARVGTSDALHGLRY